MRLVLSSIALPASMQKPAFMLPLWLIPILFWVSIFHHEHDENNCSYLLHNERARLEHDHISIPRPQLTTLSQKHHFTIPCQYSALEWAKIREVIGTQSLQITSALPAPKVNALSDLLPPCLNTMEPSRCRPLLDSCVTRFHSSA